ncbi:lasso peptide biosynthesis B2 protein [Alkalihalobacillus sp. LMS39]|uniref:lasso peptide biosynthesis B2 protein n=1 Tax=Alkalihalobacillus sp. LMS39 TaxID=2924032 RepID=UPI001FB437D3|nr:lasso peptide biosynthesis B2 protein [Alkalihalobacillus sp. LMS39]UOE96356.1 lasso peptide biosynthesis B2 protein [Alkalihalobacillus sp. LMS39]
MMVEAYFLLGWARIIKLVPFSKVAPTLGEHMNETSYTHDSKGKEVQMQVADTITIMSRYTFWESKCLVQAIAAMKMLKRRKIESTLYLGTGKDEGGNMIAHAWLRSGPYVITGSEGKEHFTVVATFAQKFVNQKIEGVGVQNE